MKLKLASIFLIIFFIGSTNGYGQETILDQKIDIYKDNVSIAEVLKELEKKLDFTTAYSDSAIDLSKVISIHANNKTLDHILKYIFSSKLYHFKVISKKLLIYKRIKRYTISGYISEEGSEEYLSSVSIYIPELKTGTTTNDYGFYSLSIPEGMHELSISFLGYKSIDRKVELISDTVIDFNLEPDTQHLDEIIINLDKETNQSQVTQMSSEKLDPSLFQDIPAILGEKDAIKILQLLPGVQSGVEGSAGFYVRGGGPDQNLIVLDEAIVYNSNHLFGIFSIFNGDAIKSVEIFKGGFPARFGGRLSSVVKIDTKNGNKEKLSGKVNTGLISSSFLLEGPIIKEKTSFVLSARRTYADLLILPFLDKNLELGYHFADINAKLHHVIRDKDKLYWSTYFGKDKFKYQEKTLRQKVQWGNITSTLRWNHEFDNKLFSNTSLIFSNYKFTISEDESLEANKIFSSETSSGIDDYGIKQDFNYYPNPNHTIKFGLSSTYHDFIPKEIDIANDSGDVIKNIQKIKTLESGLYIEDNWRLSDKIGIYPGIRLSHFQHKSKGYFKPEVRFSVAYKLYPSFTIKGSYAKMNQYIHKLSNSGLGLPTDLWISSTNKLKPQLSQQIALGIAKDFLNNKYELTIEGYYKKMEDIISFKEGVSFSRFGSLREVTGSIRVVDFVNGITTGKGWAYGSEFLFRKKTGKLTGWLGYTLSWSQRQFEELNRGKKFNDSYDRRHDFSMVGVYKPNKKITISGNWIFTSGINYDLPNTLGVSVEDNFPIDTEGENFNNGISLFNTEKNNFKGEDYHRLDLGIQFHKITKRNRERTWGFSFYNVYARKNPFYYDISKNEGSSNVLYRRFIFQFLPSFNYSLKF